MSSFAAHLSTFLLGVKSIGVSSTSAIDELLARVFFLVIHVGDNERVTAVRPVPVLRFQSTHTRVHARFTGGESVGISSLAFVNEDLAAFGFSIEGKRRGTLLACSSIEGFRAKTLMRACAL